MSTERTLVASFIRSREAFDRVAKHLAETDLTEQAKVLVKHIGEYYERDAEADRVDPALLTGAVTRSLGNPKHQAMFADLVTDLSSLEVSPANVVQDFIAVRRASVGSKLASLLASAKPLEEVLPVLEEYDQWAKAETVEEAVSETLHGTPVLEIVTRRTSNGGLIKLLPKALNDRLDGGLLRGHHVVVFARPEVGKTAFVINAIRGFAAQNLRTLYIGNEDPLDDIVLRLVGSLADLTKHEVIDNPGQAEELARARGYDNVVLASLAPGTVRDVENLMIEWEPDVVVTDQLRNLQPSGKLDNFTQKLESVSAALRALGKKHKALMVSVTQAGDSASGKSILDMGDVDSSNTGIPATCDVLAGIGMSAEDEAFGRRMISLAKNKPGGNHSAFPVLIDTQKSRLRSE